jgi:thiol-disulfide isomerase/thioredoxin
MDRRTTLHSQLAISSAIVIALLFSGCEPTPLGGPVAVQSDDAAADNSIPLADVKLEIVDGAGYQAALDKHRGHVVLVDFWATWCEPCVEKFPHVVDLHRQHEAKGLRVIGFSCNQVREAESVKQFLAEHGASFDNLLTKFGNGTQTNDTFDLHGVPQYKPYDRAGKLRYQFSDNPEDLTDGRPVDEMDQRVAELLAEAA